MGAADVQDGEEHQQNRKRLREVVKVPGIAVGDMAVGQKDKFDGAQNQEEGDEQGHPGEIFALIGMEQPPAHLSVPEKKGGDEQGSGDDIAGKGDKAMPEQTNQTGRQHEQHTKNVDPCGFFTVAHDRSPPVLRYNNDFIIT